MLCLNHSLEHYDLFDFFYHFSKLRCHKWLRSFLMKDKNLFIIYSQCHGCLWHGHTRSHGISNHSIDLCFLEYSGSGTRRVNTLRPRQNGRHFADDLFKCIFLNGNLWISIKISLKFVPKGPINNIPALVQIMAWRCPGDKPLSEAMMVSLPMHICVTRPQWVKSVSNPLGWLNEWIEYLLQSQLVTLVCIFNTNIWTGIWMNCRFNCQLTFEFKRMNKVGYNLWLIRNASLYVSNTYRDEKYYGD